MSGHLPRMAWRVCSSPSLMTSMPPRIGPQLSSGPDQQAPFCLRATSIVASHILHEKPSPMFSTAIFHCHTRLSLVDVVALNPKSTRKSRTREEPWSSLNFKWSTFETLCFSTRSTDTNTRPGTRDSDRSRHLCVYRERGHVTRSVFGWSRAPVMCACLNGWRMRMLW